MRERERGDLQRVGAQSVDPGSKSAAVLTVILGYAGVAVTLVEAPQQLQVEVESIVPGSPRPRGQTLERSDLFWSEEPPSVLGPEPRDPISKAEVALAVPA